MATPKLCAVAGCDKRVLARGWCPTHYTRWRRRGDHLHIRPCSGTKPPKLPTQPTRGGRWRPYRSANHCGKKRCPAGRWMVEHVRRSQPAELERQRLKRAAWRAATPIEKQWHRRHPALHKASNKRFLAKRPGWWAAYIAQYRADKLQATPRWLTPEHHREIAAVYRESKRVARETGVPHEVDHIVPLNGKTVCGLHVPWNLRVLTAVENNRRPRVYRVG